MWDAAHYAAAQAAALGRHRPRLRLVTGDEAPAHTPVRLEVPGDVDVAPLDLRRYDIGGEQ